MSARPLRIGTRASALALWQAHHVEALLNAQPGAAPAELVHIKTAGDLQGEVPLWQAEGRAFFTKEIDRALREQIRRLLALPMSARTHFLRRRLPTGGSAL